MHLTLPRRLVPLILVAALSACGEPPSSSRKAGGVEPAAEGPGPNPAAKSTADRVKERLLAFFDLVRPAVEKDVSVVDGKAAAAYVVYRGPDAARNWKDLANYDDAKEKRRVDDVVARVRGLLARGAPKFGAFRSERESEGEWLVWEVTFGEGDVAKKAQFAFLDVKGTLALGDID